MAFDIKKQLNSIKKRFKFNKSFKDFFKKTNTLYVVLGAIAVFLVLFLSVMTLGIYKLRWENQFTLGVTQVVPFPAARVNSGFVSYNSYLENLNIMKKYQSEFKKVDFKSDEGKAILASIRKDTLDRLVEDKIVKTEAKRLKVSLSNKELNESFDDLIKSNGGEKAFAEVLKKYYGLTPDEFKQDIYKDRLLRQKVADKYSSDDSVNADAKKRAEEVLAKVKTGEDFANLAKQYSQDNSAQNGGDLGAFGKGKMVPEFEQAAFALKAGETSELVKTVYGYHIIKVTENNGEQIKASHILIKTKDFNQWLEEAKKTAKIKKIKTD